MKIQSSLAIGAIVTGTLLSVANIIALVYIDRLRDKNSKIKEEDRTKDDDLEKSNLDYAYWIMIFGVIGLIIIIIMMSFILFQRRDKLVTAAKAGLKKIAEDSE